MSFMVTVVIIVVPSLIHLLLTICWRNLDMHHLYRTSSAGVRGQGLINLCKFAAC